MASILERPFSGGAALGRDMKVTVKAATDTGKVREHNEDSFLTLGGKSSPPRASMLYWWWRTVWEVPQQVR